MQSASGITDDVGFAACAVHEPGILNRLINIFESVTNTQNVFFAQLSFHTDGKLSLAEWSQIRVNRSKTRVDSGSGFIRVNAQVSLTAASCARHDKSCCRAYARSRKTTDDISNIETRRDVAGENLKIIFEENVTAEQTARQGKFHTVEES